MLDVQIGNPADLSNLARSAREPNPKPGHTKMRYAPLHTGSDEVVKMLEAAHLQGKFFPALELLFGNQQRWVVNHVSQTSIVQSDRS